LRERARVRVNSSEDPLILTFSLKGGGKRSEIFGGLLAFFTTLLKKEVL